LGVTDSLGVLIKDFKGNKLGLERGGCFEDVQFYFKLSEIEKLEKEYGIELKGSTVAAKRKKKLSQSQLQRKKCRKIAEKFWKEDPTITIKDMIKRQEIRDVSRKPDGNFFKPRTVRNWINNLCPNRSPGRRPKKT